MKTPLNPQQRLKKTLAHLQPDRPPIQAWLTHEVQKRLQTHFNERFGTTNLDEVLEVDFRFIPPRRATGLDPDDLSGTQAMPEGIYQNITEKPLAWIQTQADVNLYKARFDPDSFDFSSIAEACRQNDPFIRVFGNAGIFDLVNGLGARGRGMAEMICDIATEDPVAVALVERHTESDLEYCRRGLEAGQGQFEILYIGEDCGNQNGPVFSPGFFRRFFAPRLRRFVDLAHRHGAACMMHSCGAMRDLLPILIDDVGLDILDACQPEARGMDPQALKRDFGDRITFCGMLSLQQTLAHGTPEDCRREARHRIDIIGQNGGYIFGPANTITLDTPLENILAVYEEATGKELR
ncbi:hypothetical protein HQ520_18905 [bacterium]|nr:hypothetical protein [bacterium]